MALLPQQTIKLYFMIMEPVLSLWFFKAPALRRSARR